MQTRASVGRLLESRLGRVLHAAEALTLVTGLSQALAMLYPSTEHQRQRLIHSEPDGSTEEAACVALTQVWDAANEASPTPSPADRDNYVAAFVEELMEGCAAATAPSFAAASFISAVWVEDEDRRVTHAGASPSGVRDLQEPASKPRSQRHALDLAVLLLSAAAALCSARVLASRDASGWKHVADLSSTSSSFSACCGNRGAAYLGFGVKGLTLLCGMHYADHSPQARRFHPACQAQEVRAHHFLLLGSTSCP